MNQRTRWIVSCLVCWIAFSGMADAASVTASTSSALAPVVSTTTPHRSAGTTPSAEEFDFGSATPTVNPPAAAPSLSTATSVSPTVGPRVFSTDTSTSAAGAVASRPEETAQEKKISRFAKISRVHVEGQKNIRERVILAAVKTHKGILYDPDQLRRDVESIYALADFDDVTVDVEEIPSGIDVIFHVVEKPLIKKIEFKGNKKLSKGKLSDAIALKENDPLDKLKLNLDVDKLINTYKDEGFAAAQVEPYTTSNATNHVTVTFYVTEGTQVIIDSVSLQGVTAFPQKKIIKLMKMRRKKVFKQDQLLKDIDDITKFYKNNGYMNIKIGDVVQNFNPEKTRVKLAIPVTEGPLFHFGQTHFSGDAIFPKEKLAPDVEFRPGEIFSQDKINATVAKLQDTYGTQGYIRVQIKPDFSQNIATGTAISSNTVDTTFNITEGEVVYVDHISIEGNTHTKDFVIRREIKLKEGDPFNSVLARKSVERLYNLGFLDNVDVDVQQPNSPNKADVIFTVTEGKPGSLSAGAGYSSVDGLIGTLQLQHINFLGRGQRLNLQVQFGGRLNSYDVGWTEPWFLGKPIQFGVDAFRVKRLLQLGSNIDAYETRDTGASVTMGPRFSDIYSLLFTYSAAQDFRYDVASDIPTRTAVLGPQAAIDPNITEAKFFTSNLTEQLTRDGRDNQFDPTRGTKTSLALTEGGLGPGAIQYYKAVADASIHIPTFWKFVLSIHGNWGYVQTYGGSTTFDIINELFRVGGSDTVRGYDLGQVGASSITGNAGGHVANVYNIEYKFPIAPDEHGKTLLQGVLFYDVGGDWDTLRNVSYKIGSSTAGLKQGVGFGIRFKTPVFPLRLDYGIPLNKSSTDKSTQFYFNVGSLF